ncbi:Epididymal-specific lipocalin-6, partial [Eschrichtius robustus]|nr:Epididymal-specific lipocalin-6 [Eschrichtius robustus]
MLLGSWYILAVASGEKDFVVEKATKNIEGVVVTLTPDNTLKMLSSRHRLFLAIPVSCTELGRELVLLHLQKWVCSFYGLAA